MFETDVAPKTPAPADFWVDLVAGVDGEGLDDRAVVDQLDAMERLTSAAAAAKARLTAELHARRLRREAEAGVSIERRGRAVGHEVALARHESPHDGREHTALALALVHDLPETLSALARGDINEQRAQILARETADLTRADRAIVDATLGPQLAGMGNREITVGTRRLVFELDSAAAERRARRARARRRVTSRGLPDCMSRLTAELPAEDAVAAMDSLREHTDLRRAMGDERGRDQIMADELAARLCRPALAGARGAEVQLVMSADMLLRDDDATPAHLVGYGPVPPNTARRLLRDAEGKVMIRRLYANPDDGSLVAMDSRGILFPRGLRRLLAARDGETCRTPWCDAPVRHADHVTPRARGGRTTLDGGQGLCEACNYAKESPGWRHLTETMWPRRHAVAITTPTGHTYQSQAPPLPVRASPRVITMEIYRPMPQLELAQ
jgi:5-methylcytosine-specific restriction endonuclease McrA